MREPPNTPGKGDRVRFRGRPGREGLVTKVNPTPGEWDCTVEWDDSPTPMLCHRFELERVGTAA